MKTFEIYRIEDDASRTLIASVQADYYETRYFMSSSVVFFRHRFMVRDVEVARHSLPEKFLVGDTEFVLALPDPPSNPVDAPPIPLQSYYPEGAEAVAAPKRRRSKSSGNLLNLD